MSKGNILLVEDDPSLGFVTRDNLQVEGYNVHLEVHGRQALDAFENQAFDLCLLDIMLPGRDGFELAREIRSKDEFVPIIFLTARNMDEDRWKGFEIGGDDYITKPFSIKELLYKIAVFIRRSRKPEKTTSMLSVGTYTFDLENLKLSHESMTTALTQMEGELLKMLAESQGQLVKREEILINIWGENDYFKGRSLDVFISRLRKYLSLDEALTIKNHHGVGFSLMNTKSNFS